MGELHIPEPAGPSLQGVLEGEFIRFDGRSVVSLLKVLRENVDAWLSEHMDTPRTTCLSFCAHMVDEQTGFEYRLRPGFQLLHDVTGYCPDAVLQRSDPVKTILFYVRSHLSLSLTKIDPEGTILDPHGAMNMQVYLSLACDTITHTTTLKIPYASEEEKIA